VPSAHFQNLSEVLCRHLNGAKHRICIAVCWFSHREIFETLLNRLRSGVRVELLIEYDTQNIRQEGLDFQMFIRMGGQLYGCKTAGLMHHKFALVDDALLLSGSFNWTYNSNAENLIISEEADLCRAFQAEFERLKALSGRIRTVRREDAKIFSVYALFENTHFPLTDLRKKVSGGAGVWLLCLEKTGETAERIFREGKISFDREGLLAPYWRAYRMWDEALFAEELEQLKAAHKPQVLRELRRWTRRMRSGDVVLATEQKNCLRAVGIVQSVPMPTGEAGHSSCRVVQWLKILPETAVYTSGDKPPSRVLAKYNSSALRLLQEIFEP
jgi:PLD-like domain